LGPRRRKLERIQVRWALFKPARDAIVGYRRELRHASHQVRDAGFEGGSGLSHALRVSFLDVAARHVDAILCPTRACHEHTQAPHPKNDPSTHHRRTLVSWPLIKKPQKYEKARVYTRTYG